MANSSNKGDQVDSSKKLYLENAPPPVEIRGSAATLPIAIQEAIKRSSDLSIYPLDQLLATTQWIVGIAPDLSATDLAASLNAQFLGAARLLPNTVILEFPTEVEPVDIANQIDASNGVEFYYPLVQIKASPSFVPNDPLYGDQWHLKNTGQSVFGFAGTSGEDINVETAWNFSLGSNVVIGIVDDGLDYTNPDLAPGYRADLSFDYITNDPDPAPFFVDDNHGTAVAGVAAARGNNGIGVSGSAPQAFIAGLRTDFSELSASGALSHQPQNIQIYNNSWGFTPASRYTPLPPMSLMALLNGVQSGRGGRGSIYTWAAGNGLAQNDNVNSDGYGNSRYVIAVGAINFNGKQAAYSEPGAAMLVTAHSGGGASTATAGITTTDRTGANGYNTNGIDSSYAPANYPNLDYTNDFDGTSSSTPLVSGVIALMLQANPNLTWRDVKHILVDTARKNDPIDADWATNGAGHHINHKYGFGAVNAAAAVATATTWANVKTETNISSGNLIVNTSIPDNNPTGISLNFNVTNDIKVETVEVVVNATHSYRGDLRFVLTSPSGTPSILAEPNPDSNDNFSNWVFSTVRNWDESSLGTWTLKVADEELGDTGTFVSWGLNIYGTSDVTPKTDLSVNKIANPNPVNAGGDLTYTITVNNLGTVNATDVIVKDTLPRGFTVINTAVGSGFAASQSGNVLTFSGGNLNAGQSTTLTIIGTAPNTIGNIINTVVVDPNNTILETDESNNIATVTTGVTTPPLPVGDLSITKTDNATGIAQGGTLTYTIAARNNGTTTVTNATVTDAFPNQLTGIVWTATGIGGATGFEAAGTGNINDTNIVLPAGATVTYIATATVNPSTAVGTVIGNTATIIGTGITEFDLSNNTATDANTFVIGTTTGIQPVSPSATRSTAVNILLPIANASSPDTPTGVTPTNAAAGEFYNLTDNSDNADLAFIPAANGLQVRGLSGNDFIQGTENADNINGNAGADTIRGLGGDDSVLRGGRGSDLVEGGLGNDVLNGNNDNDTVIGGEGDDTVRGGAGNDLLYGDAGNDVLIGDRGQDILAGGNGSDVLVLRGGEAAASSLQESDIITDFDASFDKIGLTDGIGFANLVFEPVILTLGGFGPIESTAIRLGASGSYLGIVQGYTPNTLQNAALFLDASGLISVG